ncbi:unnamed protein product [Closterium sp. NIES-53]
MTTRITPGVGANLIGQHAQERNQDATAYVGNLDPQVRCAPVPRSALSAVSALTAFSCIRVVVGHRSHVMHGPAAIPRFAYGKTSLPATLTLFILDLPLYLPSPTPVTLVPPPCALDPATLPSRSTVSPIYLPPRLPSFPSLPPHTPPFFPLCSMRPLFPLCP